MRAYKDVAESIVQYAVEELHNLKYDQVDENGVLNGVHGKYGRFLSLHRCVTTITMESCKILDLQPRSKVCHTCKKYEGKDDLGTEELKAECTLSAR